MQGFFSSRSIAQLGGIFAVAYAPACSHHVTTHNRAQNGLCARQAQTAEAHLARLDSQSALLSAQEALRLCPTENESLIAMGRALAAADRLEEACRALERARLQQSRKPELFFVLVDSYDVLGEQQKAAETAADFLVDHPHDAAMRGNLASALLHLGRPREAVKELREILKVRPNDVTVWDASAHALLEARAFEEARQAADHALTLSPCRIESRLLCARALWANGEHPRARAAIQRLLREHPRLNEGLVLMRQLDAASLQ